MQESNQAGDAGASEEVSTSRWPIALGCVIVLILLAELLSPVLMVDGEVTWFVKLQVVDGEGKPVRGAELAIQRRDSQGEYFAPIGVLSDSNGILDHQVNKAFGGIVRYHLMVFPVSNLKEPKPPIYYVMKRGYETLRVEHSKDPQAARQRVTLRKTR